MQVFIFAFGLKVGVTDELSYLLFGVTLYLMNLAFNLIVAA